MSGTPEHSGWSRKWQPFRSGGATVPGAALRVALCHPGLRSRFDGVSLRIQNIEWEGDLKPEHLGREDGIAVEIRMRDGLAASLVMFRSTTTSDQLYHTHDGSGGLVITDHFRNALSAVPHRDRQVDEAAQADHFLFRTVPCGHTYCPAVLRLGHGELLEWDLATGERRSALVPLELMPSGGTLPEAVRRLDEVLTDILDSCAGKEIGVNLLSGGVDSTLMQSYFGSTVKSANWVIDSPEFEPEKQYAELASRLLGARQTVLPVRESEYFESFQKCIAALGTPPHHLQTVLMDRMLQTAAVPFFAALQADALYGLDPALRAERAWRSRNLLAVPGVRGVLPASLSRRLDVRRDTLASMMVDPGDPGSFAANMGVYAESAVVNEAFGAAAISASLERRVAYVQKRLAGRLIGGNAFARQVEFGQWVAFYSADTVCIWRQLAYSRGASLFSPFALQRVVAASTILSPPERYVSRGRTKPPLKVLLRKRVPQYPVDQLKGGGGLPFRRFLTTGPLAGRLREFDRPAFFSASRWQNLEQTAPWTAWNTLTYLTWQRSVLRADVAPVEATRTVTLPLAHQLTAPIQP